MARIQLKVQGVTDISATHDASLLIVTDMQEEWQLTIICNPVMRNEIAMRRGKYVGSDENKAAAEEYLKHSLPETLSAVIKYMTDLQLSVVIVNVFDGEYRAVIEDKKTSTAFPIRVSDGVLLSYADKHIPLYIEESLWLHQRVKYHGEDAKGVSMPLNTLSMTMLQQAMDKCIENEDYELAQQVKNEIERRETINNRLDAPTDLTP